MNPWSTESCLDLVDASIQTRYTTENLDWWLSSTNQIWTPRPVPTKCELKIFSLCSSLFFRAYPSRITTVCWRCKSIQISSWSSLAAVRPFKRRTTPLPLRASYKRCNAWRRPTARWCTSTCPAMPDLPRSCSEDHRSRAAIEDQGTALSFLLRSAVVRLSLLPENSWVLDRRYDDRFACVRVCVRDAVVVSRFSDDGTCSFDFPPTSAAERGGLSPLPTEFRCRGRCST